MLAFAPLTLFGRSNKVTPLRSDWVVLSQSSSLLWASPTPPSGFPSHFARLWLIGSVTLRVLNDPSRSPQFLNQLSQHSTPHTPEGSLALHLQVRFTPSLVFVPHRRTRLPLGSLARVHTDDAAGFTSCYGLLSCDDTASVFGSLLDRMVTTRLLGHYLDWSFTS